MRILSEHLFFPNNVHIHPADVFPHQEVVSTNCFSFSSAARNDGDHILVADEKSDAAASDGMNGCETTDRLGCVRLMRE